MLATQRTILLRDVSNKSKVARFMEYKRRAYVSSIHLKADSLLRMTLSCLFYVLLRSSSRISVSNSVSFGSADDTVFAGIIRFATLII